MKNIYEMVSELKDVCEEKKVMRARIYEEVDKEDIEKSLAGPPRFPLSPSACLKPARDLYYDLINYYSPGQIPKDPIEPRAKLLFENGYVVEDLLKKYVKKAYKVIGEQQYVSFGSVEGVVLGGSIDWAIDIDGEIIICDSKSSGDFPFKQVPKEENIAQMQLYMHSSWAREKNINRSILIYYNKNDSNIKCVEVPYNPKVAQELLDRFISVYICYKGGRLPKREFVLGVDWKANYSAYRTYDNVEFTEKLNERELASSTEDFRDLEDKDFIRDHVLTYGNKIVDYKSKKIYAYLKDNKIKLAEYKGDYNGK